MKSGNVKNWGPLIGVQMIAALLGLALVLGARVFEHSSSPQENLVLLGFAIGGAVLSIIDAIHNGIRPTSEHANRATGALSACSTNRRR